MKRSRILTFSCLRRLSAMFAFGVAALALGTGCSDSNEFDQERNVRINELQFLGTHNSYHVRLRDDLFQILLAFEPELAPTLDYSHVPLQEQFESQGIRHIELDIFDDPQGGLYATRRALALVGDDIASGLDELDEPGLKVLHVQEIDYETTCLTFVSCLTEVRNWSDNNPSHLPIMILVEAKDDPIPDPLNLDFTVPLDFDTAALNRIDEEILSVFPLDRLITPDRIRGDAETLEQGLMENGWPTLSEARGKIMFALDNTGAERDLYLADHPSLRGRVMFTDSTPGDPEAAFMKRNGPLSSPGEIEALVSAGYLVRTRADADTIQARSGDTTRRDAALASGAQFISTDYPVPDPRFTDYRVELPGDGIARCNPVNPGQCETDPD